MWEGGGGWRIWLVTHKIDGSHPSETGEEGEELCSGRRGVNEWGRISAFWAEFVLRFEGKTGALSGGGGRGGRVSLKINCKWDEGGRVARREGFRVSRRGRRRRGKRRSSDTIGLIRTQLDGG